MYTAQPWLHKMRNLINTSTEVSTNMPNVFTCCSLSSGHSQASFRGQSTAPETICPIPVNAGGYDRRTLFDL